jgi:Holliday junction DNA helicase RuvB
MIGQSRIIEQVDVMIESAIIQNRSIGHILISGAPGLGKTTIAEYIKTKSNRAFRTLNGTSVSSKMEVITTILSCPSDGIIFIDEIHAIPKEITEVLLTAMEGGWLSVPNGKESVRIELDNFTIVAATTNPGKILKPVLDRFSEHFKMDQYSSDEIEKVVMSHATNKSYSIDPVAARKISSVCLGIPRNAIRILNRSRDLAIIRRDDVVTLEDVTVTLARMEIDENGFDKTTRDYMKYMQELGGSTKLKSLCAYLAVSQDHLEMIVEPILIAKKLIQISSTGRQLTKMGKEFTCH